MRIILAVLLSLTAISLSAQNTFPTNGNVGIGTTSPNHKLDINTGGGHFKTYTYGAEHTVNTVGGWARAFRLRNENDDKTAVFGALNGHAYISTGFDIASDATGYRNQRLTVLTNGNVGIGTTNTRGFKLAVNGNIGADEIQVKANYWSDFVFNDDYKLKDLEEVESFIEKNNHLPDIPSEQEVKDKGINLGDMDAKLLQKIEELTLYMIEQNKKTNKVIKENKDLKNRIVELEAKS